MNPDAACWRRAVSCGAALLVLAGGAVSARAGRAPDEIDPPASCASDECHPKVMEFRHLHWPDFHSAGECQKCHEPNGNTHEFTMAESPALCLECHEELRDRIETVETVHEPVEDGCLDCHYGSGQGYLFGEHTFRLEDDLTGDQHAENCNVSGCHATDPVTDLFDQVNLDTIAILSDSLENMLKMRAILDPADPTAFTYATFRVSRDLQIWLVEGRLYRSPNKMPDGPDKTIWGETQKQWLKDTLLASDATFKILISPTPLVGPDGNTKRDNHTNLGGFRHEAQEFFDWLKQNGFLEKHFYVLCGDRHWQYHAKHPSGFEEFSCGALVEANSRLGVKAGSPKSTDPEGKIQQYYCQLEGEPSAGFMMVTVSPKKHGAEALFAFYDEQGHLAYSHTKYGK